MRSIMYYFEYLITHRILGRIFDLLIWSLLAMGSYAPAQAQTHWPVTEFEVFEGMPWGTIYSSGVVLGRTLGGHNLESKSTASVPLTPALKNEMEKYLHEVAVKMQKLNLPAPYLEPVITRDDGTQAFRIYYFDFGKGNSYDPDAYALAGYGCKNEANHRRIINVNASKLTASGGGVIADKGYVDLAHELFHTVQRGSRFYDANCEPPQWLTEGMAEAIGTDLAVELRHVKLTGMTPQIMRWGLRPYYERLAVDGNADIGPARAHSYQTSSFWRYLAELAHYRKSPIPTERWPEASVSSPRYGLDYTYVSRLLAKPETLHDQKQILDILSNFLRHDPAFTMRLSNIYPVFAATFANYGLERVNYKNKTAAEVHKGWIKSAFGECPIVTLDPANKVGNVKLSLNRVTARCVHVNIGAIAAPTTMDISTVAPSMAIGEQLYLGTAGGKSVAQGIVTPAGAAGYIARWDPNVEAGDSFDLILSNVADDPRSTLMVDLNVQFILPESTNNHVPPSPQPVKKKTQKNNNKKDTVTGVLPEDPPQTSGSRTVSSICNEVVPEHGCGWPASDFDGYCGPTLGIDLQTLPASVARMSTMGSPLGLINQVLGTVSGFVGPDGDTVNFPDASEFDGLRVKIEIPLPNFGETPSINTAKIEVEGGGWPNSGTYGPRDLLSGPQTYFAPSGQVTIEEYSVLLLRGSYEARLVALPMPYADKISFMELPVIGTLKGSFLIPRPCGKGIEQEEVEVDVQRVMDDVKSNSFPNNSGITPPAPTGNAQQPASSSSSALVCDCSCSGMRQATAAFDAFDSASGAMPDANMMGLAMCMMNCAEQYQQCEASE